MAGEDCNKMVRESIVIHIMDDSDFNTTNTCYYIYYLKAQYTNTIFPYFWIIKGNYQLQTIIPKAIWGRQ